MVPEKKKIECDFTIELKYVEGIMTPMSNKPWILNKNELC